MGAYLFTRDLMLEAVPYSPVNIPAACEIWEPVISIRVEVRIGDDLRGGRMSVIQDVPAPRELASIPKSFR
jgi:hypothetical protein